MLLRYNRLISFLLVLFFCTPSFANFNPDFWPYIQERMFGVRTAVELPADNDELIISGPKRAASGAQVPVSITVNTKRFVKI